MSTDLSSELEGSDSNKSLAKDVATNLKSTS